ncbi:MAG: helix-turn-helix domain-containing protein [Phycisphaera sp.]|nr:helix-turn-helix domain-containing protein [Phycisphaera sp.]
MAVLEYLATHNRSATITELAERLDYPTASVFRITAALEDMGYLSRDPATKAYALTNQFLLLGQPQGRDRGLVEAALPAMRAVRKKTGETTQLCCLVDRDVVILEQLLATHPFKYSVDLGARCPVYSCAPGKAMVAFMPDDAREELIGRLRFKKFTENTITTREAFRRELDEIRACGYAIDRAEGLEGIRCIAAPIRDRHGLPVGSITIAGPSARIREADDTRIGKIVAEACAKAEQNYNA